MQSKLNVPSQSNTKKRHSFPLKKSNATGILELVEHSDAMDKENAKSILVDSFICEYINHLTPEQIHHDLTSWRGGNKSVQKYYENYFKTELEDFEKGKLHYWVQATIDGQLVGWATFEREAEDPNAVYMNLLVVHPHYQKMGIGEQLVKSLLTLQEIPDLSAINLYLRTKNKGGKAFYSKLGFELAPTYKRGDNYVDMKLLEALRWNNPALQLREEENTFLSLSNVSMMVLGGFISAVGITAVALAFTLLNAATLGLPGLVMAGTGIAATLGGVGLFAIGAYRNNQITSDELNLENRAEPSLN